MGTTWYFIENYSKEHTQNFHSIESTQKILIKNNRAVSRKVLSL
jgi:hypothetical protein